MDVIGTNGNDSLDGTSGNDSLRGLDGNDLLRASAGNDTLDGGAGTSDAASYADWAFGITASLNSGVVTSGGKSDVLIGIEWLIGTTRDDTLTGSSVANFLDGRTGDDLLQGLAGNDLIEGGDGEDTLMGGEGDDSLKGGDGVDLVTYTGASTGVVVDLAAGTATGQGSDTIAKIENAQGSAFNDRLSGGDGVNQLRGAQGNDTLIGLGGFDMLEGGVGNDSLDGGDGFDFAIFQSSDGAVTVDLSTGRASSSALGTDTLVGIEAVYGTALGDSITGDAARNVVIANNGGDTVSGMDGDDLLITEAGDDSVLGGAGNDRINGGNGSDTIDGGDGNDTLMGWYGDNRIEGGNGTDTVVYLKAQSRYKVTQTGADAWIVQDRSGKGTDTLSGIENLQFAQSGSTISGRAGDALIESVGFNDIASYADAAQRVRIDLSAGTAIGTNFNNVLVGFRSVRGSVGHDLIQGDADDNSLEGGDGNDWLDAGDGSDTASYKTATLGVAVDLSTGRASGGAGSDTLSGFENLEGSVLADALTGDSADNTLDGGSGADTLSGGAGADVYLVDSLGDIVLETAPVKASSVETDELTQALDLGSEIDTVVASISYTLTAFVENLELATEAGAINGTGNELNNALTGNDTANVLTGGSGNDTLDGAGGIDTATYDGARSRFVTRLNTDGSFHVQDSSASLGTDTLMAVERLRFTDGQFAIDFGIDGSAREAALLIGSAVGTAMLSDKALVAAILGYFDTGATMTQACELLVTGGTMAALAGGATNLALATLLYRNVVGATPDAATAASLSAVMDSGQMTQAQFLLAVAASSLTEAAVNLTGLTQTGLLVG